MESWPRISIVTPSLNQGRYIAQTIESVLRQEYPNLEHIVMDGGSTDGTLEILARYPHLKVVCEKDDGHADAINKGFRLASGDIWGFLNSDDTLVDGALHRIAKEIDPHRGRHVVVGRCRFIDEKGEWMGLEHPSHFESQRRLLKIWKGHQIPQPATFWTPQVWNECGPMDGGLGCAWIDYDLFCRFARRYRFHFVDQVLATYRLHNESKTNNSSEQKRLEESIAISRRHWGPVWSWRYWDVAGSLALYRLDRIGRVRRWLREAEDAWQHRRFVPALRYGLPGTVLAPNVVFYVLAYPRLRRRFTEGRIGQIIAHLATRNAPTSPQTAIYQDRTTPWDDGWVGPRLVVECAGSGVGKLRIRGRADLTYMPKPLVLSVWVDHKQVGTHTVRKSGRFAAELALPQPLEPGAHEIEIKASSYFVPHGFLNNEDHRPLSWRVDTVEIV